MQVEMALRVKRGRLSTVRVSETGMTAASLLRFRNIGVLVAKDGCGTEGDALRGSLPERNALHADADHGSFASSMPVSALMMSDAVTCQSHDTVGHGPGLTNGRHVPVPHGKGLVGVISIRDMLTLSHVRPRASAASNSLALMEAGGSACQGESMLEGACADTGSSMLTVGRCL